MLGSKPDAVKRCSGGGADMRFVDEGAVTGEGTGAGTGKGVRVVEAAVKD